MVDRSGPQIRFGHVECVFDLKQLMVIVDHLIIRDIQVGDISLDTLQCSGFVDQFLVELFAGGRHTQELHFF